jgi:L,D-transpeptidase YnhG
VTPFLGQPWVQGLLLAACASLAPAAAALAADTQPKRKWTAPARKDGQAEARLIEVYQLVGAGLTREALKRAQALVEDHPNFQLAQLVYGDLLAARSRPARAAGGVPLATNAPSTPILSELREESLLRLKALRERPPEGQVPAQFIRLSARNRHALAIDTSRARLYLFENGAAGLKLLADYYISVGKSGTEKDSEGDMRTPLGVYHVMSTLDGRKLQDFYGVGALPINYPNPYDVRRGKTGSGIWLHGTPSAQFVRAPRATDGCVVLANPDLERIIRTVEIRTTPVVIARSLTWLPPDKLSTTETQSFERTLEVWRDARNSGDLQRLLDLYTPDMSFGGKDHPTSLQLLQAELDRTRGRPLELKGLSVQRWTDAQDTMVVTFGEVLRGAKSGPTKRQYWLRTGTQWKIFYEGVIG